METINRADIKKAPYNPRTISESGRRKLKAGLKRHGLVAPITMNKRTGCIVGGHQRLAVLDSIMGKGDYEIEIAVIDVDEKREKELNLLLNNQQAMGEWDMEALGDMLKDSEVKLEGTGFDAADVYKMFGDDPFASRGADTEDLAKKLADALATYSKITKNNQQKNNDEFYIVIVFRDADKMQDFFEKSGLPKNRYQSAEDLLQSMGIED